MTLEEEVEEKYYIDKNFKKQIKAIRERWGIGQKKYKTVIDWEKDTYDLPFGKGGKITKKCQELVYKMELEWSYRVEMREYRLTNMEILSEIQIM